MIFWPLKRVNVPKEETPQPQETPTSDFGSNGSFEPSEPSTPGTPVEPFQPRFKVKVTEPVKDGDVVMYTIKTVKLADRTGEFTVVRQYEDFEWLHHCIVTKSDVAGLIVPPLPPKPLTEPKSIANQSKKQLGKSSQMLIGDEFHKDCRSLEKYLRLLIAHWNIGRDINVENFLTETDPPVRAKVKKGLLGKLSSAVEGARKGTHRDIDDYFQKERDWANEYSRLMKELATNFNKTTYGQQRIAVAYGHLSTALNLCTSSQEGDNAEINKILVKFSEALDDAKHGADVDVANDENSLGFQLDLCSRYADALKEMHFRRTCLLVEYEDANRALDKAKPQKKSSAEETKASAEKAFDIASELARREIQNFNRQRILMMQEGLTMYADAKVKTARDTYALLAKSLADFKKMDC